MSKDTRQHVVVIGLLIIAVLSWWYAISTYQDNRMEIMETVEQITRSLTLPYHIAELSDQEPVEALPVPVYGIALAEISDTWGAARAEGRTHEGVDIFAERGTPVFAATRGYVTRLNFGSFGGNSVIVAGPGGVYYYYAHLDRVAEGIERGVPVTTDTVLGFVGNSGNATGTPPHLHFSVYPEEWEPINPYPLLVEREF